MFRERSCYIMTKYFTGVKTVEELQKRYRELLRKYHPDNKNGSTEITQQINQEYDALFDHLKTQNKTLGLILGIAITSV